MLGSKCSSRVAVNGVKLSPSDWASSEAGPARTSGAGRGAKPNLNTLTNRYQETGRQQGAIHAFGAGWAHGLIRVCPGSFTAMFALLQPVRDMARRSRPYVAPRAA